jgi:RNA polymerase sigma factor (sigma-70 family)
MDAMDDSQLLREYAMEGSETAFAALVQRHIHFVYSSALRQVRNTQLAEEVTQAVFIILARKAGRIKPGTVLAGWFFNTARYVAATELRAAAHRHKHEQEAGMESLLHETTTDASWEQIAPFLDEGLARLGEKDRQAVLLRFFEEKSFQEVGAKLGANEDAARMRVARALKSLRRFFLKRGLTLSVAGLAAGLAANAVQAAPASLVASVAAGAAWHGAATAASGAGGWISNLLIMTKAKIAIGAALLAGILATPLILQQHALATARAEQSDLQARLRNLPAQTAKTAPPAGTVDIAARDQADLERLRLEVPALQGKIADFSAQAQQLAAVKPWHKPGGKEMGIVFHPSDARDVGQATPEATLQTLAWVALNGGDTNRVAQLYIGDAGVDAQAFQAILGRVMKDLDAMRNDAQLVENLEIHLLEEQPGDNNDRWIVGEINLKGVTGKIARVLLRPTDTGWKWVVDDSGNAVLQQIPDQP